MEFPFSVFYVYKITCRSSHFYLVIRMVDKNNVTEAKPHLNLPIKPKCIVFLNLTTKCHITGISVEKRRIKIMEAYVTF